MPKNSPFDNINTPLYRVVGDTVALWTLANLGFYIIFPILGLEKSYNSSPISIALYYLFWAVVGIWIFWDLFIRQLEFKRRVWLWVLLCLLSAGLIWSLLHLLTLMPGLNEALTPFVDILPATVWYFLPKASEILVQQVIISALVLALHSRFHSLGDVKLWYVLTFGSAHVALFALSGTPTPYATLMTLGAVASTFVFPHFILKVRGGFLYSYMIHLCFYISLAFLLRI